MNNTVDHIKTLQQARPSDEIYDTSLPQGIHLSGARRAKLQVYLINLDRAERRLELMAAKLNALGIAYQRIAGVDGQKLTFPVPEFSEISYRMLHGRRFLPAEVGCYLSHINCAKQLLDTDADFALILEDDVTFAEDAMDSIGRAIDQSDCWDILRLTTVNSGHKFAIRPLGNGRNLAMCLTREKGAGAYVVNRKAAKWMIQRLLPIRLAYDIAFDLEFMNGLNAAFIHPLIASQFTREPTQIQTTIHKLPTWRYFSVLPYRSYLEVARVVLRTAKLARHLLQRSMRDLNHTTAKRQR
ncbi:glycosyltransferase family 25 protein [Rhizobium sp. FY34]|uniref:glycosyltransferase family 25 protein n=1 Tax=Rhizobium sp. FY34 TaxID=2562309 RepID=UPI0010C0B75B|nr:glycosyltransferase family 25 protein [Rhizobium sp. FY34]